jgi:acyl carrier protein
MSVQSLIAGHVQRLIADRGLPAVEITYETPMLEDGLGLDSLDMATLVAVLEKEIGKDPFAQTVPAFRTFGEFVRLYE